MVEATPSFWYHKGDWGQVMSNLICGHVVEFSLWQPTDGMHGFRAHGPQVAESQGPIPVRVRVRQYGDSVPHLRTRPEKPDFGRLPVGTLLDCYV